MISNNSLKYYRIVKTVDDKGRTISKAVYIGGDYRLDPPVSVRTKITLLCLSGVSCLSYIAALCLVTQTSRIAYIVIPFVFLAVPLFLITTSAVSLLLMSDVLMRHKAEAIAKRLPRYALIAAILACMTLIGFVFFSVNSWEYLIAGDFIFGVLSFLISLSTIIFRNIIRNIQALPLENTQDSYQTTPKE